MRELKVAAKNEPKSNLLSFKIRRIETFIDITYQVTLRLTSTDVKQHRKPYNQHQLRFITYCYINNFSYYKFAEMPFLFRAVKADQLTLITL